MPTVRLSQKSEKYAPPRKDKQRPVNNPAKPAIYAPMIERGISRTNILMKFTKIAV